MDYLETSSINKAIKLSTYNFNSIKNAFLLTDYSIGCAGIKYFVNTLCEKLKQHSNESKNT